MKNRHTTIESITAKATVLHDLDKAEGAQPDLNFHLLQLAELERRERQHDTEARP